MAKINPTDEKFDGGSRTDQCGPGVKLCAAVGYERYTSSGNNPMLGVRFVCVLDREGSGDEGKVVFENFTLTEKAMWRIVQYARAVGYDEPFDPEDNDDVGKLLTHGYVDAVIFMDTWKNKENPKVDRFEAPGSYTEDPDWGAQVEQAEEGHREYLKWRESNPRDSGNPGRSGGGGGRGGNRGGGGKSDKRIPF